jgi:ATP-dependent RNA helicase DDX19/DBP5
MNVNQRPNTESNKKLEILKEIYGFFDIEQSIIFVTTRDEASSVAQMFVNEKYSVSFLHGKLPPETRDDEFKKFREGKTKVLVTTNVLARGVNVPSVDVVVNYNLPTKPSSSGRINDPRADPDTYVHRMGRCGRFGRQGTAITFIDTALDEKLMMDIEKFYSSDPQKRISEDWDPNKIEDLADVVRQRSLAAVDPVHLECSVEVKESA